MTTPTRNLSCRFVDPGGAPLEGATVTAHLSGVEAYNDVILPQTVTATTDSNGECVLALFPNELGRVGSRYAIQVQAEGQEDQVFYCSLPDADSDLADCLVARGVSSQPLTSAVLSVNGETGAVQITGEAVPVAPGDTQTVADVLATLGTAAELDADTLQAKLTAGSGISIATDGTISALGGALPPGGLPTGLAGGSQDERNHLSLDANITVSNGVATLQLQSAPGVQDLPLVSIGKSNPQNDFDAQMITGRMSRVGSQTFTIAVPGWINGNGTTAVRFLEHWAPASYARHVRDFLNGGIDVVTNQGHGGERTSDGALRYRKLDGYGLGLVLGSLWEGNDVDNLVSPAASLSRLREMINYWTGEREYLVQNYGPPAVPLLDAAHNTVGKALIEGLIRLRKVNPKFLYTDTFDWTVLPTTGQGDPLLFATPTNIHFNQDSAFTLGALLAAQLVPLIGVLPDRLVQSVYDDVGVDAASLQICPGWWTPGAVDASTLNARATGVVHSGFTGVQISGTAAVQFSTPARADGYGYSQRMVFSGQAGDSFTFDYVGPGNAMAARTQIGQKYDPGHTLAIRQSSPGTLGDWEAYVAANLSYPSGNVNGRLSSWMRLGTYDNPPRRSDIRDRPIYYPSLLVPGTATAVNLMRFSQAYTLAKGEQITIEIGRPTMRQQSNI